MNILLYTIFIPIIASLLCFAFRRLAKWVALLVSLIVFVLSIIIFLDGETTSAFLGLRAYNLSAGILLAASFITVLISFYSIKFMEGKERLREYYGYLLITLGAAAGAVLASDFVVLLVFWGILGITLYLLIGIGGPEANTAAKKTFIIVGGADALMILGISIVWMLTRTFQIGAIQLPLNGSLTIIAFLSLAAGAFAKAGAMPLHSWIPESAEKAPASVMAYLPASLDKLVGIYFLTRICVEIFMVIPNSPMSILLLLVGSFTIIAAVMGALVQHNLKKLLSFHAVSQVGYMVLGIGTGIPIGIAGGLFHMLNNAIYKCCLFLAGGAVEKKTGTTDLDQLGGLARFMPLTFISALIAALSISGVPPFNGFASKWMIYQGVVELGKTSPFWVIWLIAAMFGSALTLASFMKLIHATFLGQWSKRTEKAQEVSWFMWLPMISLALLCVIFGVFAYAVPIRFFIQAVIPGISYTGIWSPAFATILIIIGLLIGAIIYWIGKIKVAVAKPAYVGGELLEERMTKVSGVDFYETIKKWGVFPRIYKLAEMKLFDIYELLKVIWLVLTAALKWLHNGLLHTYLAWILLGTLILVYFLVR